MATKDPSISMGWDSNGNEIGDETPRFDEDFKRNFTQSLEFMKTMFEDHGMLVSRPRGEISGAARAMGKAFYDAILSTINENEIVTDEQLILSEDDDFQGEYEECTRESEDDNEFDPNDYEEKSLSLSIPMNYKAKAVAFAAANPKASVKTMQCRGFAKLKHRKTLERWRNDVRKGGSRIDKLNMIDEQCFERFNEARKNHEQVTTRMVQQWAMTIAFPYISDEFSFLSGATWVQNFKNRHRIRQRKITKFISKNDVATLQETIDAAEKFTIQTKALLPQFSLDFVINTDQTGCQYQSVYDRSLDYLGAKTVLVKKQNLARVTHSYTAQYSITASGKLLPKVFLCMAETDNKFGPRVMKTVKSLAEEYKNIVVTCSKSGKLTKELYKIFLETTIKPYVKDDNFLLIIDSWGGQLDTTLYDEVFSNGNGEVTCTIKVIPPKCTPLCQPCDVYFYRQVKNLIKKIQHAPELLREQREIASREDSLKIHSLVHHQLFAPAFEAMLKYAWFASKLIPERAIFRNVNETCFPSTLWKRKCQCGAVPFIKCSWCETDLCFKCFYDNYHPKSCSPNVSSSDEN